MARRTLASLSAVILLGTVFVGLQRGQAVWASLRGIDVHWALIGLASYGCNYWFRTLRLCGLLEAPLPRWPTAFAITGYHGFFTYLLPVQSGDLTLPVLLKARGCSGWGEGARVLVASRLLDLSALGVWVSGAAVFSGVPVGGELRALWLGLGMLLALLPWLVTAVAQNWGRGTHTVWGRAAAAIRSTRLGPCRYAESLAMWAAIAGTLYSSARAVGLDLGIGGAWFLVTVQLPLQVLPVQGLANAGNHEAGWVAALSFLGLDGSQALAVALASHALLFGYVLVLGCVALLARQIDRRKERDAGNPSTDDVRDVRNRAF